MTRRQWAAALAGASAPLAAQKGPEQPKPAVLEVPAAQKAAPSRSERLRQFPLQSSTEPAFIFKP